MDRKRNDHIEQMYLQYHDKLVWEAYRLVGSVGQAEVLVQELFILAIKHYDELSKHPNPEGWLVLTLHNQALNYRRLVERHGEVPLDDALTAVLHDEPAVSLDDVFPSQLSEEDRKILTLRYADRMSHEEIANVLGISNAASRVRLSRALERCKKYLKKF